MCKSLFYLSIVILVLSVILYLKYSEEYRYINKTYKKKKSKKEKKGLKKSKNFNSYFRMNSSLNPDGSTKVSEDQIIDTNGKRYSRNMDYIEYQDGTVKMLPVRNKLMC